MRRSIPALLLAGAVVCAPHSGSAQASYAARPDVLPSHADSLDALRALDAHLAGTHTGPEVWHERGVLAWRLSNAERRTGYMKREANDSLLALADSSLRLAARDADLHPDYLVDLGRFYLTSNSAKVRSRATDLFEKALKAARRKGDAATIARAADELGMTWWRRYEDRADRHIYSFVIQNVKDRTFLKDPRSIAYFIDNQTIRAASQDWSGQREYLEAWEDFADALRADPGNQGALRHTYMALADRQRWAELQHVSRVRLNQDSTDAWAWLANGLAERRLGDDRAADAAFHEGLRHLPDAERDRYDRLSRIFTPKDSASLARLPEGEQENLSRMYWLMADPLWATPDNEHRIEFLSRVVYAELRFSVEEFGLHGADTDRGTVYVRYGPPPAVITFPPDPERQGEHRIRVLWWYSTDEAFLFDQLPTYRVVTLEPDDRREFRKLRDTVPVVWALAGDDRHMDSVDVQLVRFRAGPDSADVFVAAHVPVARMVQGIDLARGALQVDFQGYTWRAEPLFDRTFREVLDFGHADADQYRSWSTRVHAGTFLYRVEALQPDAMRGARGASRIEVADESGFGMSDLLVAGRVAPRPGAGDDRWSDFDITPNLGRVKRGQPFALLWETYGLTPKHGTDDYQVSITLTRERSGGLASFAARIIGGVAGAVGLSRSGADHVALTFPRQVPARPVAVDYIAIDLGTAPPGAYKLQVAITDNVTHQTVTRESAVTVVE
ncbi:MAG TPA: GWxTD domain-containing protein [Gemmatimonadaceae bacterium]|nr:GWxTD domain-containing protein [Gemmatimonadaceae bacterium]